MSRNFIWQIVFFIVILLALNWFFHLHISIIGSLVLTLVVWGIMSLFQSRS